MPLTRDSSPAVGPTSSHAACVNHETAMRRAIRLSIEKMEAGEGGPFGAVIVKGGEIIAEGSPEQVARVRRYIQNQESHHRRTSFKEELIELLQRHGIEYDERYLL